MKNLVALAVTVSLVLAQALAQAPISVTTRLVPVAVIVRDKHGPVGDLSRNDFEIFEKGKPRQIASFSIARANDRPQKAALAPNTFSNRANRQGDAPVSATVLLFDGLNTTFKDQASARAQALEFLRSIDIGGPMAVYSLGNDLRVLHDFTEDPGQLAQALEGYRSQNSALLDNSQIPSDYRGWLNQMDERLQEFTIERRVATTLSAMRAIANRMAGVPGRKNLIWVSSAFPLGLAFDRQGPSGGGQGGQFYSQEMKEAAQAIDRANVAVYPVDARGLAGGSTMLSPRPQLHTETGIGRSRKTASPETLAGTGPVDTMKLLADWTGGRAFYNSNDIRGAIRQATEDSEITYTLGFYAEEKDLDGTYHQLEVKVAHKGADVRYRKGYFATAATSVRPQAAGEILNDAVRSPVEAAGIGLTGSLTPSASTPGGYVVTLGLNIQELNLVQTGDHWADNLNLLITLQSATGTTLDSVGDTIRLNVTDANRRQLIRDGLVLKVAVTPAPGLSQIRVAVLDPTTGNVGSLRMIPPA